MNPTQPTESRRPSPRIALPILAKNDADPRLCPHFGQAPAFLVVDSDGSQAVRLESATARRPGECAPIRALAAAGARVILTRAMGRGALGRCHEAGLQVLETRARTVFKALDGFRLGRCADLPDSAICHHHSKGRDHDHDHDHGTRCSAETQ